MQEDPVVQEVSDGSGGCRHAHCKACDGEVALGERCCSCEDAYNKALDKKAEDPLLADMLRVVNASAQLSLTVDRLRLKNDGNIVDLDTPVFAVRRHSRNVFTLVVPGQNITLNRAQLERLTRDAKIALT